MPKSFQDFGITAQGAAQSGGSISQRTECKKYILDAGCGTGFLLQHWPHAEIIGLDIAFGMCRVAGQKMPALAADMECLPLATGSMEGVFSSLALQWAENKERFLSEAHRVTKPGGWLRLATLIKGTLAELQAAYTAANLYAPILNFTTLEVLERQLQDTGWQIQTQRVQQMETEHQSARDLLRHLKGLGARHKQERGIQNPGDLRRLEAAYKGKTASWQVVMIHASKP